MTERKAETTPARIAPLANLPLFHKLEGRKAVVAGGSEGALWKAELLSAAGADVLVLAGHEAAARLFDGLARQPVAGPVTVLARGWEPTDLAGAALALADISDDEEAARFIAAARAAGAPVNVIDRTELCDFTFGTIVNRSPVVIGISTGGGAPMLGQSIRARIESVLPLGLSAWAKAALAWRPRVKAGIDRFQDRRGFWTRFVARVWAAPDRAPSEADFDALVAGRQSGEGSVTLVGAGPGDPELLTLKAVRALQSATIILYDDLVTPEVLELARREARRVSVGKKGHGPSVKQSEIDAEIVRLALAGERVVRLKGGDPLIFGRATEEIEACRAAGVPVEVVPGISAAQGAAAALGFSLTERVHARRLQFVTGHGSDGKLPQHTDFRAVADNKTTTIVYMPVRTLADFSARAGAAGLSPATPVLLVASATRSGQVTLRGTFAEIRALAASLPKGAPVLLVIGQVARDPALLAEAA